MKLYLEWSKPLRLKDASADKLIFKADTEELPAAAGLYVFGRRWGQQFEALYVGKAANIRSRVKSHFNNLRLMNHIKDAKNGQRIVYAATLVTKPPITGSGSLMTLKVNLIPLSCSICLGRNAWRSTIGRICCSSWIRRTGRLKATAWPSDGNSTRRWRRRGLA